jgi:hypothetical protein
MEIKSGSGINISDNISKSLETIFWVKNTKFFSQFTVADPGSGTRDGKNPDSVSDIRDKHLGSYFRKLKNNLG